jgi:hypothetical protein
MTLILKSPVKLSGMNCGQLVQAQGCAERVEETGLGKIAVNNTAKRKKPVLPTRW